MTKKFKNAKLRIPPQNIESEKALLGSVMLKPDILYDILDIVSPDVFYTAKHRLIYDSMVDLFNKREPIDLLSLSSRMKERGTFEDVGGTSYLTELVNSVPSSANAQHYAEIVHNKHVLRRVIEAADHISQLGYDENTELSHILDEVERKVYEATNVGTSQKFIAIGDTLDEAWERIDKLHKSEEGETRGVRTGFTGIDSKLAGLQPSDMIILAARPSMGKTAFALDIARQSAIKHGAKVGIFSLEMSSQQLIDRMLAAESGVDAWKLRTGKLTTDKEFEDIQSAMSRLSKAPIYIEDHPGSNIMTMRSVARKLKSEHGLDLLIIDYLQLIHPSKTFDNMVNQVTEISRSIKELARELEVPVLALSQLSRAVEQRGGTPRLSDLRDSGSIEQDADVVMFIHREDKMDKNSDRPGIAEIMIEKHRNGATGSVELYFDEKRTTFLNLDQTDMASVAPDSDFDDF